LARPPVNSRRSGANRPDLGHVAELAMDIAPLVYQNRTRIRYGRVLWRIVAPWREGVPMNTSPGVFLQGILCDVCGRPAVGFLPGVAIWHEDRVCELAPDGLAWLAVRSKAGYRLKALRSGTTGVNAA
jgi:hypothetical protein